MEVPVLLLVFNRPALTEKTFREILKARPHKLYIAADGPRPHVAGEAELCERTCQTVIDAVDWECEVKTLFREENRGCGKAVAEALDWFFSHEEKGIILEDDILVSAAFFQFTAYMLYKFENDETVFSINGNSIGYQRSQLNYGRSHYFNMWGWATWRRSWQLVKDTWQGMGDDFASLNRVKSRLKLFKNADDDKWITYWENVYREMRLGNIDTWDYQWLFTALYHQKDCLYPTRILTQNLGFGADATHTKTAALSYKLGKNIDLESVSPHALSSMREKKNKYYHVHYVMDAWNTFSIDKISVDHTGFLQRMYSSWELHMSKRNLPR
jgi:hypothetical protein